MKISRDQLKRTTRIALAIGIVGWLMAAAGFEAIVEQFRRANALPIVLAFVAMAGENLLRGSNWAALLRQIAPGRRVPLWHLVSDYFATSFLGSFLPSSAGTDVLRAVASQRLIGGRMSLHAAAIVMLNAITWLAGAALGVTALVFVELAGGVPTALAPFGLLLALILLGGPVLYALLWYRRDVAILMLRRLGRRWYRLRHALRHFLDSVLVFTRSPRGFGGVLLGAIAALLAQSIGFAMVGASLGANVPFAAWFLLVPAAAIAGLLPMSVSGFGAPQAAKALVLQAFGLPLPEAVAVSTLIPAVGTAVRVVIGGATLAFGPSLPRDVRATGI